MPIASPVIVTLALLAASIAQEKPKPPLPAASTEAVKLEVDPKDVATIDGVIGALYGAISGPQGEKRNWDRFRALFHPDQDAPDRAPGRRHRAGRDHHSR